MKREWVKVYGRWHHTDKSGKYLSCNHAVNLEWNGRITAVRYVEQPPRPCCRVCVPRTKPQYKKQWTEKVRMYTNH